MCVDCVDCIVSVSCWSLSTCHIHVTPIHSITCTLSHAHPHPPHRRDTEGSDQDTRRRVACELVKALTEKFPEQVTALFTEYVATMLNTYASNPATQWKAKDCAMYLVTALTVRGSTQAAGVTSTNQFVNIGDFFNQQVCCLFVGGCLWGGCMDLSDMCTQPHCCVSTATPTYIPTHIPTNTPTYPPAHIPTYPPQPLHKQVVPELQSPDINALPVLKADALKFLTNFRAHVPKPQCLALFPNLVGLLGAESNVVHSYAAIAVERLLSMKVCGW